MSAAGMARLTRSFIAAGGRLLLTPKNSVEPRMDVGLIYGPGVADDLAQDRVAATRSMLEAVKKPDGQAYARRSARVVGTPYNGWYILPREVQP